LPASDELWQRRGLSALVWVHRWLGITTCLFFAAWFASGAVMLFQPFPSLPRAAQLSLQAAVGRATISPAAALAQAGSTATGMRLVQRAGTPAYLVDTDGGTGAIDAHSGVRLPLLSPGQAMAEARRLFGAHATTSGPFDYDQWVVHNRFDPLRPFYRIDAGDIAGTQLYLSARTGELVQRTTRAARGWNRVGAVLHWAYVTPLRSSWTAWDRTVWWLSLVCLAGAVAGTILGIVRMQAARRLHPPRFSFYRLRWLRWHHLLGLGTAVFVLAWMLSGWLSMDHGRLFARGTASAQQLARYTGCPLAQALEDVDAVRAIGDTRELGFATLACTPVLTRYAADGSAVLLDGNGAMLQTPAVRERIAQAARAAWPQAGSVQVTPIDPATTYALAEGWPASALRVTFGAPKLPDLTVDGDSGRLLTMMDDSRAAYAWIYYALHTFNVPSLTTRPTLRKLVVLVPLLAGFLFSLTGVVIGWRRLRRATRTGKLHTA
jgi:uncharacterized iron-regulated membrane protein